MSANTFLETQAKFVENTRNYRPAGWLMAWANARATWLNFDHVWDNSLGQRIVDADVAHKEPPVSLLSVARLEVDAFVRFREQLKKDGLNPSIKATGEQNHYKAMALTAARVSNPVYVDVHNRMFHHMWHVWVLPPASGLSMISKYIFLGTTTGLFFGAIWRYGYHLPERRHIDAFYKSLYADHPEYWPALAMQKKVRHRSH